MPSLFDEDEQLLLIQNVKKLNEKSTHPALYDIEQMVIEIFKKICNNRKEILENYCVEQEQNVDGVPSRLVFNMDEAGQDEYVDAHAMKDIILLLLLF